MALSFRKYAVNFQNTFFSELADVEVVSSFWKILTTYIITYSVAQHTISNSKFSASAYVLNDTGYFDCFWQLN